MYYIRKGNKFITKNNKGTFNIHQAITFDNYESTKRYVIDNLSEDINNYCIYDECGKEVYNFICYIPERETDIIELLKNAKDIAKEINRRIEEIAKENSNVDKKINDIYHYIEFNDLNAVDGYKAYKLLHNTLKERRDIKNTADELNLAHSALNKKTIESVVKGINTIRTKEKKYTPRVMNELFQK